MSGLTKQAVYLDEKAVKKVLNRMTQLRYSRRNRLIVLLGIYAGLRAKEIAGLQWRHVLDSDGNIGESIRLTNDISKGNSGGIISLNAILRDALEQQLSEYKRESKYARSKELSATYVVRSSRSTFKSDKKVAKNYSGMKAQSIVNLMRQVMTDCDIEGGSSHSMRRTFITNIARKIGQVDGSMNDVRELARHKNLQTTQRYIARNSEAQSKVVDLI